MPSAAVTPGRRDAATKKIGTILAAPSPIRLKPISVGTGHGAARGGDVLAAAATDLVAEDAADDAAEHDRGDEPDDDVNELPHIRHAGSQFFPNYVHYFPLVDVKSM